ncbi:MAG: hypothetical protein LBC43_02370 [Bifidobacteriaceae bacterium]|jgi:hypothetical protein|nr:hypothetical protein [Bifidobacteriaceae bacterium]
MKRRRVIYGSALKHGFKESEILWVLDHTPYIFDHDEIHSIYYWWIRDIPVEIITDLGVSYLELVHHCRRTRERFWEW